jgi:methionine biosynthesis protein MetW
MKELNTILETKPDIKVIYDMVPPGSRVLDLGCGDGTLLKLLKENKGCKIQGIDCGQQQVMACIGNGVPVIQMNLDQGLTYFQDDSFDFVILGLVFQQIHNPHLLLREMNRVGRYFLVSVFNLGYIKTRLQLAFRGKMPVSKRLPYEWYDTPNIHLGTQRDFRAMCVKENFRISSSEHLSDFPAFLAAGAPNLFSNICIFKIES